MATPHDNLFRETFGQPEHAAPLLRSLLPDPLRSLIDWPTLCPAPEHLVEGQQTQATDRLFAVRVAGRPALLYLLLESTVRPSRWTALQVLAYIVGIWRTLARSTPRPRRLPLVIPVVVSLGRRRWRASTDIASLLDVEGLSAAQLRAVSDLAPSFRMAVHDFAGSSPADVRALSLSLLGTWTIACQQFMAPVGDDEHAFAAAIAEWADVARQVLVAATGQEALDAVFSYLLKVSKLGRRRLGVVLQEHLGAENMTRFVSTWERITKASEAKGRKAGQAEGRKEGKMEGRMEGRREGRMEGKAEGITLGAAKGRVAMFLTLLRQRFGRVPRPIAARLATASAADLDRWAKRLLTADRLAVVFADS